MGTGIHQLILLASACIASEGAIVCMEEPELHLHPAIQRRLVGFLEEHTDNHYLIATHSAQFIDLPTASLLRVHHDGEGTRVAPIQSPGHRYDTCHELGYRASDIVQANSVIWVEGPSDRIYLRHWLQQIDPTLKPGIHYSVMFYGGRLLSHLTAEEFATDLICLRHLNRQSCILIDSDRTRSSDDINPTKQRIIEEFSKDRGIAWVTEGREIENYLEPEHLRAAIKSVHRDVQKTSRMHKFDDCLSFSRASSERRQADKVDVARYIVRHHPEMPHRLDLAARIRELVNFIRDANHLEPLQAASR